MRNHPARVSTNEFGSLTIFTVLEPVSVGGLLGILILRGPDVGIGIDISAIVIFILGVAALFFSLFHLGRPWRAPLAILHFSTSWLSREVILFALFLCTLLGYAILPNFNVRGEVIYLIGLTCASFGMAATIATGKTYQLKSRPSWYHWSAFLSFPLGALSTGLLFGIFIEQAFYGTVSIGYPAQIMITALLVISLVISLLRSIGRHQQIPEVFSSRSITEKFFLWLLMLRIMAILMAMGMLWISPQTLFYAWIPALIAEFADRILFFNTVIPVTLIGRYT